MQINAVAAIRHSLLFALVLPALALAHGGPSNRAPADDVRASAFGVRGELAPPPPGVAELKFREFFRLPIGPRGLEPSAKLQSLDGKRVRLIGYMADREEPASGFFTFAPLPGAPRQVFITLSAKI
jgi:hypothetical protein